LENLYHVLLHGFNYFFLVRITMTCLGKTGYPLCLSSEDCVPIDLSITYQVPCNFH